MKGKQCSRVCWCPCTTLAHVDCLAPFTAPEKRVYNAVLGMLEQLFNVYNELQLTALQVYKVQHLKEVIDATRAEVAPDRLAQLLTHGYGYVADAPYWSVVYYACVLKSVFPNIHMTSVAWLLDYGACPEVGYWGTKTEKVWSPVQLLLQHRPSASENLLVLLNHGARPRWVQKGTWTAEFDRLLQRLDVANSHWMRWHGRPHRVWWVTLMY